MRRRHVAGSVLLAPRERLAVLSVTRYRVSEGGGASFRAELRRALAVLSARPGFIRGHVARAADDPGLWLLSTQWAGVGAYRRAMSSYDVKVHVVAILSAAADEPTAFEVLDTEDLFP